MKSHNPCFPWIFYLFCKTNNFFFCFFFLFHKHKYIYEWMKTFKISIWEISIRKWNKWKAKENNKFNLWMQGQLFWKQSRQQNTDQPNSLFSSPELSWFLSISVFLWKNRIKEVLRPTIYSGTSVVSTPPSITNQKSQMQV